MLSCKQVSQLVSESLDRDLSFRQRVGVRLHLMMCGMCRAYEKQMLLLRKIAQIYGKQAAAGEASEQHLSAEARKRMKQTLSDSGE